MTVTKPTVDIQPFNVLFFIFFLLKVFFGSKPIGSVLLLSITIGVPKRAIDPINGVTLINTDVYKPFIPSRFQNLDSSMVEYLVSTFSANCRLGQ